MRRTAIVSLLLFTSLSTYAAISYFDDLVLNESKGPTYHSVEGEEPAWESYSYWTCFDAKNANFECSEYGVGKKVPGIVLQENAVTTMFDIHPEDGLECEATLYEWRSLDFENSEICIFAAEVPLDFPEVEAHRSKRERLFYIEKIRGPIESWSYTK